jgi:hypothetical protein
MSRRQQNRTDESTATDVSISDSLKSLVLNTWGVAGLYFFGDEEQRTASPEVMLRRMLSTKSAITTKSSLAEANQRAHEDVSQQHFSLVGKGQCGTVYSLKGTTMVVKLPNAANKNDELFIDFQVHKTVSEAFSTIYTVHNNIHIPKLEMWVSPESSHFWSAKAALFGHDVKVPNYGLVSERIYPLPLPVREAIVDALCPKAIIDSREEFLKKPENKDCLVRLYLGRKQDTRSFNPRNVKLRNFPLHLNEMERIGLDTQQFARVMAEALAVLHWKANVDANDVEFVLGSTPLVVGKPNEDDVLAADKDSAAHLFYSDFEHRTISVWLLDFNECRHFEHNQEGLSQLIRGFWFNDPYYPRPNSADSQDKNLWTTFSSHYLEISAELVKGNVGPQKFIDGVVAEGMRRGGSSLFG